MVGSYGYGSGKQKSVAAPPTDIRLGRVSPPSMGTNGRRGRSRCLMWNEEKTTEKKCEEEQRGGRHVLIGTMSPPSPLPLLPSLALM